MSSRTRYTFIVLRYVHDIVNAEFVNVGVVLNAPDQKFLGARMNAKFGRITRFFPPAATGLQAASASLLACRSTSR